MDKHVNFSSLNPKRGIWWNHSVTNHHNRYFEMFWDITFVMLTYCATIVFGIYHDDNPHFIKKWEFDSQANSFRQMASFPTQNAKGRSSAKHGGEDVSVYAIGPQVFPFVFKMKLFQLSNNSQAHLVTGVHEQSYLAHVAAYAGCLRRESLGCPTSGASWHNLWGLLPNWFDPELFPLKTYVRICLAFATNAINCVSLSIHTCLCIFEKIKWK